MPFLGGKPYLDKAAPGDNPSVVKNGWVLFAAGPQKGDSEIYTMNIDGSGRINLTENPARDVAPTWSPDGKWIAFLSNRTGAWQVFRMDANGSNVRQLSQNSRTLVAPNTESFGYRSLSWSPDGRFLIAERYSDLRMDAASNKLVLIRADGSGTMEFDDGPFLSPCWSPDGKKLAFITEAARGRALVIWDAAELALGKVRRVDMIDTPLWQETQTLQWSPDSKQLAVIALNKNVPSYSLRIFQARQFEDSTVYTFPEDPTAAFAVPAWMPDNGGIIFAYQDKLYLVARDGEDVWQFGSTAGPVTGLAVSPDGRNLLISAGAKTSQVFLVSLASIQNRTSGGKPILLSAGLDQPAFSPSWRPAQ